MAPHAVEVEHAFPSVVASVKLNIVVASIPFWGHTLPLLRVAQGLIERGHTVTLITSSCSAPTLKQAPEAAGLRLVLLDDFSDQDAVDKLVSTSKGNVLFHLLKKISLPYALKALADLHAREPVDHCVIDFVSFAFHEAAKDCGLPYTVNLPGGEMLLKVAHKAPTSRLYREVLRNAAIWTNLPFLESMTVISDIQAHIKGRPVLMHSTPSLMLEPWVPPADTKVLAMGSPTVRVLCGVDSSPLKPNQALTSDGAPTPVVPPLPEHLEAFLSQVGDLPVILFTLGSLSGTMKLDNLKELVMGLRNGHWKTVITLNKKAVSQVPANLLDHSNLLVCNWIPQAQVIADPRIHAVVTHCGWGASMEVVMAGKPVVCLPSFGDQPMNADLLVSKGMGIKLDLKTVKAEAFEQAVLDIIQKPKYSQRAQEIRDAVLAETYGRRGAAVFIEHLVVDQRTHEELQIRAEPSHIASTSTLFLGAMTVAAISAAAALFFVRGKFAA